MTNPSSHPTTIAISGIEGSFSEEAARTYLRKTSREAEIVYATTARGTFKSVADSKTDLGVIPLENTNGGIVLETVYAAADYLYHIEQILEIDVQQNLIVRPGTTIGAVTQIVSHHQALAQCKFYLRRTWPAIEHLEYADTALAVKDLASGALPPTTAVIASEAAAGLYGMEILAPSIQDLKFNFTSFMIISKHK